MWLPAPARAAAAETAPATESAKATTAAKTPATKSAARPAPASTVRLRHRQRPQQVEATAPTATAAPGPAKSRENEENDKEQEEERAKRRRAGNRPRDRLAELRPADERRVQRDAELARVPIGERGRDEQETATVVLPLKQRSRGALNVAGDAVGHESLDSAARFNANMAAPIARGLPRNQEDDHARVPGSVPHASRGAHAPGATDPEGDVGDIAASKIRQRDDRHFAAGLRPYLEGYPVQAANDGGIQDAGQVDDDFRRRRSVPARGWRNLDLLCGGNENSEE